MSDEKQLVLCVDDDPVTLSLLEGTLRDHRCLLAQSADEAIDLLEQAEQLPGLAIVDIELGNSSGFELVERMRTLPSLTELPVIYLSGTTDTESVTRALNSGAVDFIHKPVSPAVLRAKVDVLFARAAPAPPQAVDLSGAPLMVQAAATDQGNRFDKYVLVERIGAGGMGVVWKAWDCNLAVWVALKFIRDTINPTHIKRMFREAQAAARLDHHNICRVYDVRSSGKRHFIAMQFIDGTIVEGPIHPQRAAKMARTIARALEHAHAQGVIHRDMKPENIVVDQDSRPFITDFGISTMLAANVDQLTPHGIVMGSPNFMPLELIYGEPASEQSDVYGLGATLYTWLTGIAPYEDKASNAMAIIDELEAGPATPPDQLIPGIPAELSQITLRSMERDRNERFRSAGAFADALSAFIGRSRQA